MTCNIFEWDITTTTIPVTNLEFFPEAAALCTIQREFHIELCNAIVDLGRFETSQINRLTHTDAVESEHSVYCTGWPKKVSQ